MWTVWNARFFFLSQSDCFLACILLSLLFLPSSLLSFFIFIFDFQFYFLNYFFICRPISDPSIPMAYPQHSLHGDSSRQPDPLLLAPYFLQNHIGLNEGDLVLSLTWLHLYRSSQASDNVDFLIFLLYSAIFSIYLGLMNLHVNKFK